MQTFDDFKRLVSIAQIATDLGYKFDKKEGKTNPVYKLYDLSGAKIDEIIIKDPDNLTAHHYFDRNGNGGDVISFVKNHLDDFPQFSHSNQFVKINMILSHYANIPFTPSYQNELQQLSKAGAFSLDQLRIKKPTVDQLGFLVNERKLSPETVEKFLPFISLVKNQTGTFFNVGFPYNKPGTDEITNFELRNFGFKGMSAGGDKQNSVWIAKFAEKPTSLYFAESAIDAMSYFELNKNKFNNFDSSVFISTGGYATDNQIKNSLKEFKGASVKSLFDNDLDGRLYDIRTAAIIANKDIKIVKVKDENKVIISVNDKSFELKNEEVSMERFKKETGIRAALTVIKSTPFNDFNDALKFSKDQNQKVSR